MMNFLRTLWPLGKNSLASRSNSGGGVNRRQFLGTLAAASLTALAATRPSEALAQAPDPAHSVPLTPLQAAFKGFFAAVLKARQIFHRVKFEPRKAFTRDGQFSFRHIEYVKSWGETKREKQIIEAQNQIINELSQEPSRQEFKATLRNLTAENSRLLAQAPYPCLVEICQATFGADVTQKAQDALLELAKEHITAVQNEIDLKVAKPLPARLAELLEQGATEDVQLAAKLLAHNFHFDVIETRGHGKKAKQVPTTYGLTIQTKVDNSTINGMVFNSRGTNVPYLVLSEYKTGQL